jgi:divalent metal cation (Fe/Co/Zn/Cd) transporter
LALWLAVEGLRQLYRGVRDLVDETPEEEIVADLREHILPVPGAVAYHDFRVRRTGDYLDVDLHLQAPAQLSVAEGHAIAARVRREILQRHRDVLDVLIHVEPATGEHLQARGVSDQDPSEVPAESPAPADVPAKRKTR